MDQPHTIDNLGLGASVRWARDQKYFDSSIVKESPFVSSQTSVEPSVPCFSDTLELLFPTRPQHSPWACFSPPSGYFEQQFRLFDHQVISSLGPYSAQQACIEKIQEREGGGDKDSQQQEEGEELKAQGEEESDHVLIQLLRYLQEVNECLALVEAKRKQYTKG